MLNIDVLKSPHMPLDEETAAGIKYLVCEEMYSQTRVANAYGLNVGQVNKVVHGQLFYHVQPRRPSNLS